MTIKAKLMLLFVLSVVVIATLGMVLYRSIRVMNVAMDKNTIANQIIRSAFDKRVLLDDYLQHHPDRAKQQWLAVHDYLVSYVQSQSSKFSRTQEKLVIDDMGRILGASKGLFLQLAAAYESSSVPEASGAADQEVRLSGQLLVFTQSLVSSAGQLVSISRQDLADAQKRIVETLIGFIIGLFLFTVLIVSLLWKSIVGPIGRLKRGTEIIGAGNLEYKVGTHARDEIGQLSRAFDEMTEKVKERTVKLDASNQQLQASNQQLRASNQQLDATTQQLRAANQQLVTTGKGLEEKVRELEVFNKATVGRELKMAELKKEIETLKGNTERS